MREVLGKGKLIAGQPVSSFTRQEGISVKQSHDQSRHDTAETNHTAHAGWRAQLEAGVGNLILIPRPRSII